MFDDIQPPITNGLVSILLVLLIYQSLVTPHIERQKASQEFQIIIYFF